MTHLDLDALAAGYHALPLPPRSLGRVVLLVVREPGGRRILPNVVRLERKRGVVGDRWALDILRNVESQVTMMRADVARLIAVDGDVARFGDNLLVDLDLSADNLPPETRLVIGKAICELTPKPHRGCAKFEARAGADALAMTRDVRWASQRLRGVHLRVLGDGDVRVGDSIVVQR